VRASTFAGGPGFSLLSERHGEDAAHSLELSSQAFGLFQVSHGDGLGGCHCRLDRRRLGALFNELGVFAGEGRLEELFNERGMGEMCMFGCRVVPSLRAGAWVLKFMVVYV
jgi:hypothetical protein